MGVQIWQLSGMTQHKLLDAPSAVPSGPGREDVWFPLDGALIDSSAKIP